MPQTRKNPPANPPAHEIRLSGIRATIWRNDTENGPRFNTTFERSYRDGEEWKSSDSFGRDDLLTLSLKGLTSLTNFEAGWGTPTSLDISGDKALASIQVGNSNGLTSLRAIGCTGPTGAGVWNFSNNQLSAAAMNQFYSDLGPASVPGANINMSGNLTNIR